jgi:hypothetical protein
MPQTATQSLSILVAPVAALAVTTTSLPDAVEFQAYTAQLTASGGTAPYHWAGLAGAFPTGLTVSDAGVISGTPTASGTFTFTVQVTDSGA